MHAVRARAAVAGQEDAQLAARRLDRRVNSAVLAV